MEQSGDNKATQFLIQKVAIDVQCGNAAFHLRIGQSLPLCPLFEPRFEHLLLIYIIT